MLLGNAGLFEIDDQNADALRERGGVSIVCCEMVSGLDLEGCLFLGSLS